MYHFSNNIGLKVLNNFPKIEKRNPIPGNGIPNPGSGIPNTGNGIPNAGNGIPKPLQNMGIVF